MIMGLCFTFQPYVELALRPLVLTIIKNCQLMTQLLVALAAQSLIYNAHSGGPGLLHPTILPG